jgi:FkbM family methyltransferase
MVVFKSIATEANPMSVAHRLRKLAFYHRELLNWPAVVAMHATGRMVHELRLRDGSAIHLLDPRHEIWAYDSIYRERCYDIDFPGLPPDGTVIDLGANVGIFTLFAATRLVPHGRVLAVEANVDCARRLERTTAGRANVTVWCGAVAGQGVLWLAADSLSASIFQSHEAVASVSAPAIDIEQVLGFAPEIDLLKANIEGAEYPMLLESRPEIWRKVHRLAIKWHKDTDVAGGHDPDELAERLGLLGFTVLRHEDIWTAPGITTGITTAIRSTAASAPRRLASTASAAER